MLLYFSPRKYVTADKEKRAVQGTARRTWAEKGGTAQAGRTNKTQNSGASEDFADHSTKECKAAKGDKRGGSTQKIGSTWSVPQHNSSARC